MENNVVKVEDAGGLGKYAKPANTLVKKIASATGALLKPWQIKRIAKANAEAKTIETKAEVDCALIKAEGKKQLIEFEESFNIADFSKVKPAMQRMIKEEMKNQENMESILAQAIPLLKENSKPEDMDDDWITKFFNESRNISTSEMQEIWAKLLATEANSPNKISKQTLSILSNMTKKDALLFEELISTGIYVNNIFYISSCILDSPKISFKYGEILRLHELGLVNMKTISEFVNEQLKGQIVIIKEKLTSQYPRIEGVQSSKNPFYIGKYLLTNAGYDLLQAVKFNTKNGLIDILLEETDSKKYILQRFQNYKIIND